MASLRIPPRYEPGIETLMVLDDDTINQILEALEKSAPCLRMKKMAKSISSKVAHEKTEDISELLEAIMSLYYIRNYHEVSIEEFIKDVVRAISDNEKLAELYEKNEDELRNRLYKFLSLDHIFGIAAKAVGLITEQNNVFLKSQIFADLRPIFWIDSESEISGAVVFHNLKIEYRHDNEDKEFFVALDINDIRKLQQQLKKAEKKTEAIKAMLKKSGVNHLDDEL